MSLDHIALGRVPTDRLEVSYGDRVILEGKIEALRDTLGAWERDIEEHRRIFYLTRMQPLERTAMALAKVAWLAVGLAMASVIVAIAVLAAAAR